MTSRQFKLCFTILMILSGCASPTTKLDNLAQSYNFDRSVIVKNGYAHLVYTHNLAKAKSVLHVYLEGDGSPWTYRIITLPDPTPREPLALRLMVRDSAPSAYVGRPCYNGSAKDLGCDSKLWTSARYSAKVVASMTAVIEELVQTHDFMEVKLIGHSGGGTLAMLIAAKIPQVTHVITIAANLDTDAWTTHHRYTRLYTSLNPARQPPLPQRIKQWHLVGGHDSIVPPALVKGYIRNQENALGISVRNFSHSCCWVRVWEGIARGIGSNSPGVLPGTRFKVPYQ